MKDRRFFLLVCLIYAALLMPPFWPFLFQHQTLYQGDIFLYFEPILRYITGEVSHGRLPTWNPLVCGGAPQIAIISPGLFYLPNYIFALLPFGTAMATVMLMHQWLAGVGTFLLARRQGFGLLAATISGAILMLSGYMFGSSQCYTLAATFSWTPLGLWLVSRYVGSNSIGNLVALGFLYAGQILAGRPELFLPAAALYLIYALFCRTRTDDGLEETRVQRGVTSSQIITLLLALGCAAAMAAPALLPVLELYSLSPRMSGLRFSEVALWSAGWFDWLQTILVRPLGDLVVTNYQLSPHYPGLFPYISSLYLGPAAITLAISGLFHRSWRQKWFWLAVGAFFLLLALGGFGPLLPALYKLSPGLVVLRYPIKVAIFVLFAVAMLAGAGWDAATKFGAARFALSISAAIWLICALAGLAGQFLPIPITVLKMAALQTMAVAVLGILALILLPVLRRTVHANEVRRLTAAFTMAFLVAAPMLIAGCASLWHFTDQSFYAQSSPLVEWLKTKQAQLPPFRILVFPPDSIVPPQSTWNEKDPQQQSIIQSQYERTILNGDVNMDSGIPSAYGFVATDTKAFMMLYVGVCSRSHQYDDPQRVGDVSDLPLYRFCQISNVRYLITLTSRPNKKLHVIEPMPLLDDSLFNVAFEDQKLNLRVYELQQPLKRVFMSFNWLPVRTQVEALKNIFWADRTEWDPVITTMIQSSEHAWAPTGDIFINLETIEDKPDKVLIDADLSEPGYLVLSDTDYPGWKVYVDGHAKPIIQANGLHRAVWLERGKHRVMFEYKPYSLFWGVALSALATLALLSLLLTRKRKRHE